MNEQYSSFDEEQEKELGESYSTFGFEYAYKWSFNISIYPDEWIQIVWWIGNTQRIWGIKRPFNVITRKY